MGDHKTSPPLNEGAVTTTDKSGTKSDETLECMCGCDESHAGDERSVTSKLDEKVEKVIKSALKKPDSAPKPKKQVIFDDSRIEYFEPEPFLLPPAFGNGSTNLDDLSNWSNELWEYAEQCQFTDLLDALSLLPPGNEKTYYEPAERELEPQNKVTEDEGTGFEESSVDVVDSVVLRPCDISVMIVEKEAEPEVVSIEETVEVKGFTAVEQCEEETNTVKDGSPNTSSIDDLIDEALECLSTASDNSSSTLTEDQDEEFSANDVPSTAAMAEDVLKLNEIDSGIESPREENRTSVSDCVRKDNDANDCVILANSEAIVKPLVPVNEISVGVIKNLSVLGRRPVSNMKVNALPSKVTASSFKECNGISAGGGLQRPMNGEINQSAECSGVVAPRDVRAWKIPAVEVGLNIIPENGAIHENGDGDVDELEAFAIRQSRRTDRLKQRYFDDEIDTNGMMRNRPSIRGIRPKFGSTSQIIQNLQFQLQPPVVLSAFSKQKWRQQSNCVPHPALNRTVAVSMQNIVDPGFCKQTHGGSDVNLHRWRQSMDNVQVAYGPSGYGSLQSSYTPMYQHNTNGNDQRLQVDPRFKSNPQLHHGSIQQLSFDARLFESNPRLSHVDQRFDYELCDPRINQSGPHMMKMANYSTGSLPLHGYQANGYQRMRQSASASQLMEMANPERLRRAQQSMMRPQVQASRGARLVQNGINPRQMLRSDGSVFYALDV